MKLKLDVKRERERERERERALALKRRKYLPEHFPHEVINIHHLPTIIPTKAALVIQKFYNATSFY